MEPGKCRPRLDSLDAFLGCSPIGRIVIALEGASINGFMEVGIK